MPWNYPFHNVFNPLTAALFAGNGLVIKVQRARHPGGRAQRTCWCFGPSTWGRWLGSSLSTEVTGFGASTGGVGLVSRPGRPLGPSFCRQAKGMGPAARVLPARPAHRPAQPKGRVICTSPCASTIPISLSCHAAWFHFPVQVSEHASWSTGYYGRLISAALAAAGAPADLVQIVTGYGEAGSALVTGGVDKVIFVGSTQVGGWGGADGALGLCGQAGSDAHPWSMGSRTARICLLDVAG